MAGKKKIYIVSLVILLLVGACINLKQPTYKVDYYTLEYPAVQGFDLELIPVVIATERFSVAPCYNTSRIIYRNGPFKRNAYAYHRWRANPGDLVGYLLKRDMRESGLFEAVVTDDSGLPSSYALKGAVDEFFEWDTDESWEAVLSFSIILVREDMADKKETVLLQKSYSTKEPLERKDVPSMVQAMSRAMKTVSAEIINDVYDCLASVHLQIDSGRL